MANRKQRRRREKEKRHAYEIVEIDDEGNETVLHGTELRPDERRNGKKRPASRGGGRSGSRGGAARGGRGVAQPPSWSRVTKRGLMFAPIFFVVVYLLAGSGMTPVGLVVQTLLLLVVFVPFSYFMDWVVWRSFQKRQAKERGA